MKLFVLPLFCMIALISVSLFSCSKDEIKENLSQQTSKIASQVIISELECSNTDLVKSDIEFYVNRLFKIPNEMNASDSKEETSGSAKVIACKAVAGSLIPVIIQLSKSGKLTAWGCTVDKGEQVLIDLIFKGCDKLN